MIEKACERLIAAATGEVSAGCYELPYLYLERASIGPAPS